MHKKYLSVQRGPSPRTLSDVPSLNTPCPSTQLAAAAMVTRAPTPDVLRDRERQSGQDNDRSRLRKQNVNLKACIEVGEILDDDEPPPTIKLLREEDVAMNRQTEAANLNAGDDPIPMAKKNLDDNADLIDENGALALTLEDGGDALDCDVCFLPLRPPIFQCIKGHVLCSPCRREIGKCHVCRDDIDSRCYAMERVVESIRVPCPNAAHGCTVRPTYYNRSSHQSACPHARYSCSSHGCGFIGSAGALLDHVAGVHANKGAMQLFWSAELSRLMERLKLGTAAADIGGEVDPRDIELIMTQAGVSMKKAVMAFKESGGDIYMAIMDLTN